MRPLFTLLFIFSFSFLSLATVRTVSNVPSTLAQYNTIQAAIDASSNGDTVYIHGSPNAYTTFTLSLKQLVIIGPGYSPNKDLPFTAMVPGFTVTGASSANSEFHGLVITSTISINSSKPDNLKFFRNRFQQMNIFINQASVTYSGYLFENNWFENAGLLASSNSTYQNFLIQNNIFYETGCCVSASIMSFTNSVNVLINHNLFYGPASVTIRDVFSSNSRFLTISNNIFVKRNAADNNSFSTFNNNITFNAGVNNPWASNSNVDAGGNVAGQDPLMVAQTSVNAGTNDPLLDFTIASGPANNSAADGKDMGLLYDATGSLNWTVSRISRLPYIFSMNIVNPTIPQAGTLNVQVEARKTN